MALTTSADYITAIADIDKQISAVKGSLAASTSRFNDWNHLCSTQKCDQNALNIVNTEAANMVKYQAQIDSLNSTRSTYVTQLATVQKQEAAAAAAAAAQISANAASTTPATIAQQIKDATLSKNVKTIGVVVVIIAIIVVGYFVWKKYKGA